MAIGTVASLVLGNQAAKAQKTAANRAADATRDAADQSIAAQERMFDRQVELQEPFRQTGLTAQNRMMALLGIGQDRTAPDFGKYAGDFGMGDFQADPDPLQSLMGAGQTSTNALSSAAQQTGAGMGSTYMGMGAGLAGAQMAGGAARASGYTGMANSINSGITNAMSLGMQYPLYQSQIGLNAARTGYYNRGGNPVT